MKKAIHIIFCCTLSLFAASCLDLTTVPTERDVVGTWHGFVSMGYVRVEFDEDGTGFWAAGLPGTNVTPQVSSILWHVTPSNLVVSATGTPHGHDVASLRGVLLEKTLVLAEPGAKDASIQLIRETDAATLDRKFKKLIRECRRKAQP